MFSRCTFYEFVGCYVSFLHSGFLNRFFCCRQLLQLKLPTTDHKCCKCWCSGSPLGSSTTRCTQNYSKWMSITLPAVTTPSRQLLCLPLRHFPHFAREPISSWPSPPRNQTTVTGVTAVTTRSTALLADLISHVPQSPYQQLRHVLWQLTGTKARSWTPNIQQWDVELPNLLRIWSTSLASFFFGFSCFVSSSLFDCLRWPWVKSQCHVCFWKITQPFQPLPLRPAPWASPPSS